MFSGRIPEHSDFRQLYSEQLKYHRALHQPERVI